MRRFVALYGASPLHLIVMIASLAFAGYVIPRLIESQTKTVIIWLVGAAVLHDLLFMPIYALADRSVTEVGRRSSFTAAVPWINHLRFPAAISATLLLVYLPAISRRNTGLEGYSNLSVQPYFGRWLLVTAILFALSAVAYALRLRRAAHAPKPEPADNPMGGVAMPGVVEGQ